MDEITLIPDLGSNTIPQDVDLFTLRAFVESKDEDGSPIEEAILFDLLDSSLFEGEPSPLVCELCDVALATVTAYYDTEGGCGSCALPACDPCARKLPPIKGEEPWSWVKTTLGPRPVR